ncbi:male sterility protein-domain-containing protein [Mycena sp. CBHHK59/15]|nr:male sterility protein-domain-containing protein [Mycena sp. CBHHK59/15]
MPMQIGSILATRRIHFVVGDMTMENFGIEPATLREMEDCVTIIIHSAGNISLTDSIKESVADNCIPTLELSQLASSFKNLYRFVHLSTAYANSHLPDGLVEEKIYNFGDAETQLREILETGTISKEMISNFPWSYAFGKHLTERLLLSRNPKLPLLIIRPTNIGPAISQPYPFYGPTGSCPVSTYMRTYMESPDSGVVHVSSRNTAGSNIIDEIPVDLVANLILLHLVHGTTGIVHTSSQSYVPRRLSQFHDEIRMFTPQELSGTPFSYVVDKRIKQGHYAEFWKVMGRDWHFSDAASRLLKGYKGSLNIDISGHDSGGFMKKRAKLIAEEVESRMKKCKSKL